MSRTVLVIRLTYFCSVNLDVNVKVERGSTFTFPRDLPYIVSILFTRVNFTCIRTKNFRDSGNQP